MLVLAYMFAESCGYTIPRVTFKKPLIIVALSGPMDSIAIEIERAIKKSARFC